MTRKTRRTLTATVTLALECGAWTFDLEARAAGDELEITHVAGAVRVANGKRALDPMAIAVLEDTARRCACGTPLTAQYSEDRLMADLLEALKAELVARREAR